MTGPAVFTLRAESERYQHLVCDRRLPEERLLISGTFIEDFGPAAFRPLTRAEDVADEQELLDSGDLGDPALAIARNAAGFADLARVDGFVAAPVLSGRAVDCLREFLDPAGQLLEVSVELETYYVFNCTRVIDAVDTDGTRVRHHSTGRPNCSSPCFTRTESPTRGSSVCTGRGSQTTTPRRFPRRSRGTSHDHSSMRSIGRG